MKELDLRGPYTHIETEDFQSIENSEYASETGVYIWTIPTEEGYMITYVGITGRDFAQRMKEHLQCYLSGEYGTYKVEALKQGKTERIYPGTFRDAKIERFIDEHDSIFSALKEYLYQTKIFLIPLDGDKEFRRNLEVAIAEKVRESKKTGELPLSGSPNQDYEPQENSESVKINTDQNFIGLPKNLKI